MVDMEYYNKTTNDLIQNVAIPASSRVQCCYSKCWKTAEPWSFEDFSEYS
jgi:hypothetical protein